MGNNDIFRCLDPGCGKTFTFKANLKRHQASSHAPDGGRAHVCDECGRSFARKDDLKTHSRIHTGERPYACGVCGKAFARSSDQRSHERTHQTDEHFPCSFAGCDKRFSRQFDLRKHMQGHMDAVAAAPRVPPPVLCPSIKTADTPRTRPRVLKRARNVEPPPDLQTFTELDIEDAAIVMGFATSTPSPAVPTIQVKQEFAEHPLSRPRGKGMDVLFPPPPSALPVPSQSPSPEVAITVPPVVVPSSRPTTPVVPHTSEATPTPVVPFNSDAAYQPLKMGLRKISTEGDQRFRTPGRVVPPFESMFSVFDASERMLNGDVCDPLHGRYRKNSMSPQPPQAAARPVPKEPQLAAALPSPSLKPTPSYIHTGRNVLIPYTVSDSIESALGQQQLTEGELMLPFAAGPVDSLSKLSSRISLLSQHSPSNPSRLAVPLCEGEESFVMFVQNALSQGASDVVEEASTVLATPHAPTAGTRVIASGVEATGPQASTLQAQAAILQQSPLLLPSPAVPILPHADTLVCESVSSNGLVEASPALSASQAPTMTDDVVLLSFM